MLDAFRRLRDRYPEYLFAFSAGEFFLFVLGDAHRLVELLPDLRIERALSGYDSVRVHKLDIFTLGARLLAKGQKVALVARKTSSAGRTYYEIMYRTEDPVVGKRMEGGVA